MEKKKRINLILINLFLFIEMAILMAVPLIEDTSYLTYCYQANVFVAVVALVTVIINLKCLIKEKKTAKIESYSHPLAMLQLSSTVAIVGGAVATAVGTLVSMIMALVNDDQFFYYSIFGYYADEEIFIHVINPVLAVISFLLVRNECFRRDKIFNKKTLLALCLPAWLYGLFYAVITLIIDIPDEFIYGVFVFGVVPGVIMAVTILTLEPLLIGWLILRNTGKEKKKKEKTDSGKKLASVLLAMVLIFSAVFAQPNFVLAKDDTNENTVKNNVVPKGINGTNWMRYISDYANLGEVNLPGSHDSPANSIKHIGRPWAKTQDLFINEQLNAGVRLFDVRFTPIGGRLEAMHGPASCYDENGNAYTIDKITGDAENFLAQHPSETVVIVYQQEKGSADEFNRLINEKCDRYREHPDKYIVNRADEKYLPFMGEARGKIFIMPSSGYLKYEDHDTAGPSAKINFLKDIWDKAPEQQYGVKRYITKKGSLIRPLVIYTSVRDGKAGKPSGSIGPVRDFVLKYPYQQGHLYGWTYHNFIKADVAEKIYMTNTFIDVNETTIYWGTERTETGSTLYLSAHETEKTNQMWNTAWMGHPWANINNITEVKILEKIQPILMNNWFESLNIKNIDLSLLDTSKTKNMEYAFAGSALTELDISGLSTESLENANRMFWNSKNLRYIYSSPKFDLSDKKCVAEEMFLGTESIIGENYTKYDPNKTGKDMARIDGTDGKPGYFSVKGTRKRDGLIFWGRNIENTTLYISSHKSDKTPNAYDTHIDDPHAGDPPWVHRGGHLIEEVKILEPIKPMNMCSWFYNSKVKNLDLSFIDTSLTNTMERTFCKCENLVELDISGFSSKNIVCTKRMFDRCCNLKRIYASKDFNVNNENNTNDDNMFFRCYSIIGGKETKYDRHKTQKDMAVIDTYSYGYGVKGYFTDINQKEKKASIRSHWSGLGLKQRFNGFGYGLNAYQENMLDSDSDSEE